MVKGLARFKGQGKAATPPPAKTQSKLSRFFGGVSSDGGTGVKRKGGSDGGGGGGGGASAEPRKRGRTAAVEVDVVLDADEVETISVDLSTPEVEPSGRKPASSSLKKRVQRSLSAASPPADGPASSRKRKLLRGPGDSDSEGEGEGEGEAAAVAAPSPLLAKFGATPKRKGKARRIEEDGEAAAADVEHPATPTPKLAAAAATPRAAPSMASSHRQSLPPPPPQQEAAAQATARDISGLTNREVAAKAFRRLRKAALMGQPFGKKRKKFTPLEQQFIDIKEQYPDAVLAVEVGYKYRFFGDDAETAAAVLNIACFTNNCFMSASIPTHRLMVHTRRLVAAGHKVGIVKQTETAALKKAGNNKSGPFTRRLTAMYTKATLVGEDVDVDNNVDAFGGVEETQYIMCLWETALTAAASPAVGEASSVAPGGDIVIGFVAIHPATGDIVYDEFTDSVNRNELDTRLSHIQPTELLLPTKLSARTEKALGLLPHPGASGQGVRRERISSKRFDLADAKQRIVDFFGDEDPSSGTATHTALHLPKTAISCLAALIAHLVDFGLQRLLRLTSNLQRFSKSGFHMHLNATTVRNLELFRNLTDGGTHGSLLWVLDQTKTPFGRRLLRKWLSAPLLDQQAIEDRLAAVAEMTDHSYACMDQIAQVLPKLPDIERSICSIYYKKCSTWDFFQTIKSLEQVNGVFVANAASAKEDLASKLLLAVFKDVPGKLEHIGQFARNLSEEAAKAQNKADLFLDKSLFPAIEEQKAAIADVERRLRAYRAELRKQLANPGFTYTKVNGAEYLVEVSNKSKRKVPGDWEKMSATKAVSRYHPPAVKELLAILNQHREQLAINAEEAWKQFLDNFCEYYDECRAVVVALAGIDCLMSFALVAKLHGYTRPSLGDWTHVRLRGARHPIVSALINDEQFVPNDCNLDAQGERAMIITGPNMGGKSSYIRQVALIAIMVQMGCYVPAEEASVGIVDAVFTRMGASDNIYKRESTFMMELNEASEILGRATPRSLVIMDELGRGTSTHDGVAIAHATLKHMLDQVKSLVLFVTHYPSIGELALSYPGTVGNYHMSFMSQPSEDEDGIPRIMFLYQLVKGMAASSYGLNVAALAGLPQELLSTAAVKSKELADRIFSSRGLKVKSRVASRLLDALQSPGQDGAASRADALQHLIDNMPSECLRE